MTRKSTAPTIAQVCAILDHDRTRTRWVLRAVVGADGKPAIDRIARIAIQYPRDGAARLRVCVTDWSTGEAIHFIGWADGYGYDKLTAALDGAAIGGITLGDHCNRDGRPTLDAAAAANGWETIGG
jgi:hypothetical protein